MNRTSAIRLSFLATVLALILIGCNPQGDTVTSRIDDFLSDINNQNWTGVQKNMDDGATSYNTSNTEAFWDTRFPASEGPYTRGGVNESGNSGTVDITAAGALGTFTYVFDMTKESGSGLFEGDTYLIRRITRDGSVIFQ